MIGSNDFWLGLQGIQITKDNIAKITKGVMEEIESLYAFTGRHFVIISPASLSITPWVRKEGIKLVK